MKMLFLILMLQVGCSTAFAVESPEGWPWKGVSIGFPEGTVQDLRRYKQLLNISVVRLQIKSSKYSSRNNVSGEEALNKGLQWADKMLDMCAQLGVKGIINISRFPSDATKPNQTTPEFWKDIGAQKDVLETVSKVVKHFSKRGEELIAYDFMSEPVLKINGKSIRPPLWPKLLSGIVDVVKQIDSNRWLIVSPGPWGGAKGYASYVPMFGQHVIWGVHMYFPHKFTHQGIGKNRVGVESYPGWTNYKKWDKQTLAQVFKDLRGLEQKFGVPVLVGEFSAVRWAKGGEQYIKDLASIFDEYGWSWLYFSGTGWHGWNPDYNQHYSPQGGGWRQDYVGDKSVRWQTLRDIFKVNQNKAVP